MAQILSYCTHNDYLNDIIGITGSIHYTFKIVWALIYWILTAIYFTSNSHIYYIIMIVTLIPILSIFLNETPLIRFFYILIMVFYISYMCIHGFIT